MKNEFGGAHSTYEERCIQGFGGKTWERDYLEDLGIHGRKTVKRTPESGMGGMEWIDVA
jgi:hypothetical protein